MFGAYARHWFDLYKRPKHKPTTLKTYEALFSKHILPYFEDKPLSEIGIDDIQSFIQERAHMSKSSVRQMKVLLHEVFKAAIEDGHMQKDPTASDRLILPKKVKKREALPTEDYLEIIQSMGKLEAEDATLLALLIYTGMRRGEVLGLR